jgi:hypothetical protein
MEDLKAFVKKSWNTEGFDPSRFPGPQPISIERRHFPLLKKQPYLVCEKTDGVRHMLLCPPGSKEVYLINRNFDIQETRTIPTFPKDTILDGEFVELKNKKWLFSVYDAVRVKGVDLRAEPLTVRLEKATQAVKSVIKTVKDKWEMRVKTMLPLENIKDLKPLDQFEYETDGIVMTPVNEPIRMGTHETMFKWKPRERITVDFQIRNKKDLFVQDRGELFQEVELYAPWELPDKSIVECGYGDNGWYLVKVRTDKSHPNNRRTYFRTCINLREAIKLEEFFNVI